jgi:hypothetical protein
MTTKPEYDERSNEIIRQKISIIKGFLGTDLDLSLTVLAYTLADVGVVNNVPFYAITGNLASIWAHVSDNASYEGDDDESK